MTTPAYCEACGTKSSEGARFCAGCGRAFEANPGSGQGAAAPRAAASLRRGARDDDPAEEPAFDLRSVAVQTLWQCVVCVLTVGIAWAVLAVMRRMIRYRITSQRIEVVSGLVTITRRTVDLFRVMDLEVVEPFFLRLRGAGHITIRSQDAGEPVVTLHAIPDVHTVHEKLRTLVAAERKRQHVRVVEGE